MGLVKAAKTSPNAKFYNLSTGATSANCDVAYRYDEWMVQDINNKNLNGS